MNKSVITAVAALIFLGLGVSTTAVAASPSQIDDSVISVSFADLNIQNVAGARVLYTRLQRATESVCNLESYRESGSLSRVAQARKCYTETLDEAVARIDSDALRKIHAS